MNLRKLLAGLLLTLLLLLLTAGAALGVGRLLSAVGDGAAAKAAEYIALAIAALAGVDLVALVLLIGLLLLASAAEDDEESGRK